MHGPLKYNYLRNANKLSDYVLTFQHWLLVGNQSNFSCQSISWFQLDKYENVLLLLGYLNYFNNFEVCTIGWTHWLYKTNKPLWRCYFGHWVMVKLFHTIIWILAPLQPTTAVKSWFLHQCTKVLLLLDFKCICLVILTFTWRTFSCNIIFLQCGIGTFKGYEYFLHHCLWPR